MTLRTIHGSVNAHGVVHERRLSWEYVYKRGAAQRETRGRLFVIDADGVVGAAACAAS